MRLSVRHTETFTYNQPSLGTIQVLRMTPRDHTGHYVCDWEVDVDADCRIETRKDAFGNIVKSFSLQSPADTLTITAIGEVETEVSHGIVRGSAEKVPAGVFLRQSDNDAQIGLARQLVSAVGPLTGTPLENLHTLMGTLHSVLPGEPNDETPEQAQQTQMQGQAALAQDQAALASGGQQYQQDMRGGTVDPTFTPTFAPKSAAIARLNKSLAEPAELEPSRPALILCDAARIMGMPARLVSGHRALETHQTQTARQIWAEIKVEGFGWIGFDPTDDTCPCEESVRVAVGLDAAGILPVRAGHYGGPADFERETTIALVRLTA